jgi:hypothetical protein
MGAALRLIFLIAAIFLALMWAFGVGPVWVEPAAFVAFFASFLPIP